MKLEDQVCSLELAKKLKELGVKQESLFWWNIGTHYDKDVIDLTYDRYKDLAGKLDVFSAYTVAELGEILPIKLEIQQEEVWKKRIYWLGIKKEHSQGEWFIYYATNDHLAGHTLEFVIEKSEADARAKMLIHLLENNLIKVQ